jgi:acetyltransferase-like isoleucine patch superfamily enzyme
MPEEAIISPNIRVRGDLQVGDYTIIDDHCYFASRVVLGKYVHISHGVTILGASYTCKIGDFTAVGPGVRIVCASDDYKAGIAGPRIPREFKGHPQGGDVIIGRHCVIGCNTVILPGVVMPDGVAIGALSLLRAKDKLEPYGLYAGCPVRFLGYRERNDELEAKFWESKR